MTEPRSDHPDTGIGIGPVTTATTVAAAAVGILAWALARFAGIELPPDVQGWMTVLTVALVGTLTPGRTTRGRHARE